MKTSQPSVGIVTHHRIIISRRSPGAGTLFALGKAFFLQKKADERGHCENEIVIDRLSGRHALETPAQAA
jgi:hypothetical protein